MDVFEIDVSSKFLSKLDSKCLIMIFAKNYFLDADINQILVNDRMLIDNYRRTQLVNNTLFLVYLTCFPIF